MGACCGGEGDVGNTNLTKSKKPGVGNMGAAADDMIQSDNIFDYANQNVKDIIAKDGEYNPGKFSNDGASL